MSTSTFFNCTCEAITAHPNLACDDVVERDGEVPNLAFLRGVMAGKQEFIARRPEPNPERDALDELGNAPLDALAKLRALGVVGFVMHVQQGHGVLVVNPAKERLA